MSKQEHVSKAWMIVHWYVSWCLVIWKVHCWAFSPSNEFIVSGGRDKDVKIWNVEQGKCKVLKGHEYSVYYFTDQ